MPAVIKYGDHKIGVALLAFGTFFTISGIMLFFHKSLLRMGNLLLVAGVPMTIGPGRTAGFFFQPKKARATGFLVFGIFLVFIGWPIFGMALEIFGLLNLFGNMLPLAFTMLRQMPVVGVLFSATKKKPASRQNDDDDDRYYGRDDRHYGDEDGGRDSGERYY
jgi:Ca2+/H+ antiporter